MGIVDNALAQDPQEDTERQQLETGLVDSWKADPPGE